MRLSLIVSALAVFLLSATGADAQQRPFTTDDALRVASINVLDVSRDGRWIAASTATARDRQNVDHFRFGDPTYTPPRTAAFVVIDAESGDQQTILPGRVQVTGVAWSPDGERLAFLLHEDGVSLHLFDRSRGSVAQVDVSGEIASTSALEWRPDGSGVLIQLRTEGWAENARAEFLALSEGPIVVQDASHPFLDWDRVRNLGGLTVPAHVTLDGLTRPLLPEGEYTGFTQSEDGAWLSVIGEVPLRTVYQGNDGSEWRILRVDLASGDTAQVVEPSTDRPRPSWAPDGLHYVYADEGHVYLRSILEDESTNLTESFAGPVSESDTTSLRFSAVRWREDGEAILIDSQQGWHVLDLNQGELELIYPRDEEHRERVEESPFGWSPDGRYLYATTSSTEEWSRGVLRIDLEQNQVDASVSPMLTRSFTLTEDGDHLIFRMSDGDQPDELYVTRADARSLDLSGATRLTSLNPWLDEVALTRSELVEYLDMDGKTQYGILYYPIDYQEGERYPLVAEIYEDFFSNGFNPNMNLITSQGWFGFRPSVEFEEGFPGEAWMKGVTAGINTLIDRGLVDGDRLGVHGTSYGGYATNLLITQTDRFAAAINISGKVNIISFLGDSEKITTRNYRAAESGQDRIGATLWEQPQKYIEHSAIMFADRIDTPLLLLSGEGDWNVPVTNQREMYYALRRLGKEVVWVNYMNAGHGAGRAGSEADFHDHWNRIFDWYRTHFEEAGEN